MPQEPKKRHSRARQGKRRANIKLNLPTLVSCPNCKQMMRPHIVCPNCGFYKGVEIIKSKVKKVRREKVVK